MDSIAQSEIQNSTEARKRSQYSNDDVNRTWVEKFNDFFHNFTCDI